MDEDVLKLYIDLPASVELLGTTLRAIGQVYPLTTIEVEEDSLIVQVISIRKHYGIGGGETT